MVSSRTFSTSENTTNCPEMALHTEQRLCTHPFTTVGLAGITPNTLPTYYTGPFCARVCFPTFFFRQPKLSVFFTFTRRYELQAGTLCVFSKPF